MPGRGWRSRRQFQPPNRRADPTELFRTVTKQGARHAHRRGSGPLASDRATGVVRACRHGGRGLFSGTLAIAAGLVRIDLPHPFQEFLGVGLFDLWGLGPLAAARRWAGAGRAYLLVLFGHHGVSGMVTTVRGNKESASRQVRRRLRGWRARRQSPSDRRGW